MIKATRCKHLGARSTERYVNGAYRCYELPEGYDFAIINGRFMDAIVLGIDGTAYLENPKLSNEKELIFTIRQTDEVNKGTQYMRIWKKNKRGNVNITKAYEETFTYYNERGEIDDERTIYV